MYNSVRGTTKIGHNDGWVMHETLGYMGDCLFLHTTDVFQVLAISSQPGGNLQGLGDGWWDYHSLGACWLNNWRLLKPSDWGSGNPADGWHARTPNDL